MHDTQKIKNGDIDDLQYLQIFVKEKKNATGKSFEINEITGKFDVILSSDHQVFMADDEKLIVNLCSENGEIERELDAINQSMQKVL